MNFPFSSENDHFSIIEKYFCEKGPIPHQFESYEHFVHHTIQKIFDETTSISIETKTSSYTATFGQVYFERASIIEEQKLKYITPNEARMRDITYDSPIFVDIKEEFFEKGEKVNVINHPKVFLLRLPTMVRSSRCNLYGLSMHECIEKGECENDPGGYFIVNGKERALICQERLNYNQIYLFESNSEKYPHIAEIRSMSEETGHSILLKATIDKDLRNCCFSLPYMSKEVLAGTVFKALGFSNEEIVELINPSTPEEYRHTERLIRESIMYNTPEKAIKYISKSSIQKVEDSEERRIHYTTQVIENELFPHMGISTNLEKGILLGTMINKLFRVCIGTRMYEDRDNVSIKRIEGPGVLLGDLFRMCLKRYCDNLKKYLEKRQDIITAISRTNSITAAIKSPMATGNWGAQKNTYVRTGVSQIMSRLTYPATISHLRRIVIPIGKEGKNVKIRQIHTSQCFFIDTIESPEGKGIGIIKNFALLSKLTVGCNTILVRKTVESCPFIVSTDQYFKQPKKWSMVYVNGTLIGLTDNLDECYKDLRNMKYEQQLFSDQVSFTKEEDEHELRVFCDHGRFMRPLINVFKMKPALTKENMIMSWNELIENDIIRYTDCNEVEQSLIAMYPVDLINHSHQPYVYCEIHPSTMLGVCSAVIPYPEHNQCIFKNEPVYMADGTTKPICDVVVGDRVITFDPETQVQSIAVVSHTYSNKTTKKMYKVTTVTGHQIQATFDHQFMTSEGWKQLEDIHVNSTLVGISMTTEKGEGMIQKESTLFMQLVSKIVSPENEICDITIDSPNQSFICANFCVHNCPRLVYEASMMKQALGVYALSHRQRFDTITHVMHYPQKPLVETKYNKMLHYDEMLTGCNPIVAIACYGGWNQEDSVILNKSSVDRGMFVTTAYRTLSYEEKKKTNCSFEKIEVPPLASQNKTMNYSKLGPDGIVKKGVPVYKGDIIVGKTLTKVQKEDQEEKIDCSLAISSGEDGIVDNIWTGLNEEGYFMVKIKIRQMRIPEVGDKCACVDKLTSVLTASGWKSVNDVTKEDKVATLQNGEILYEHPLNTFEYDYDGKMYKLVSQQLDMLVTPNHKLHIMKRGQKVYELERADKIFGKRVSHKKNGEWLKEDVKFFSLDKVGEYPDVKYNVKDWCYLLGIWYAEGWASGNSEYGSIGIAANKPRVHTKLFEILKNMNIIYSYNIETKKLNIYNKQLYKHFKPLSVGASRKTLPNYVWNFSKEECKCLLEGLLLGDETKSSTISFSYWTSSVKLGEDVQRLVLHCGWSANMILPGRKARSEMTMKDGRIVKSNFDNYKIAIVTTKNQPTVNHGHIHQQKAQTEEWVDFKDKVYCLEVPGNVFYVKRNGKPYWTGNSRSSQKGVCGLLLSQEDMPFTSDGITPDLLMNPHSQPSRMTTSQLVECLYGKVASFSGEFGDATAFTEQSIDPVESISKMLKAYGFQRYGNEKLCNGFTGEFLDSELFIGPTYYQRLKHMVADKIHCLTTDHEVLTLDGWKPILDVTTSDKVATLNDDGVLEYQCPMNTFSYPDYNGIMYTITNSAVDLKATGNHRMWVKRNEYEFVLAEELVGKKVVYKQDAFWKQKDYQYEDYDMNLWIGVLGMHVSKEYFIYPHIYIGLLNKLDIEYLFYGDLIEVAHRDLGNKLPDYVFGFSKIQTQLLIRYMTMSNQGVFYTKSKILSDQFQHLCLHAGYEYKILHKSNVFIYMIDENRSLMVNNGEKQDEMLTEEKCHVVCIEVPNQRFYVRRNGKAVWTGNSRSTGNVTMMHHQPSEGRSREGGLRVGEMERDALISHGGAAFIQETLFDMSDQYQVNVCENCGNILSSAVACRMCKNGQVNRTNIPYCAKLLFQELEAMGIKIQINTK